MTQEGTEKEEAETTRPTMRGGVVTLAYRLQSEQQCKAQSAGFYPRGWSNITAICILKSHLLPPKIILIALAHCSHHWLILTGIYSYV